MTTSVPVRSKRMVLLTNGRVAWEIPPGDLARRYQRGVYLPWNDWTVISGKLWEDEGWHMDEYGCWRKNTSEEGRK